MGTKVRIEIGDRVVEVSATTREEALKAFKFAVRGQFTAASRPNTTALLRWRTMQVGEYMQLACESGFQRPKIPAIKALRNATNLGLVEAKDVIEAGSFQCDSATQYTSLRAALADYVTFVD